MSKVYIKLSAQEQARLNRICVDKDSEGALDFILGVVATKVDEKKEANS
ncbi:hypothetical protein [Fuchsiella alkaliacetigena]|nr:hypothetical protein [Fuchsiella alkaliacetigena]MCK8826000.1 hypothetical protein [Fuchsiella alkaliacetigena]